MSKSQSVGSYERAGEVSQMQLQKGREDLYRKDISYPVKNPHAVEVGLKLFAHELCSKCYQKLLSLSYLFTERPC